MTRKELMASHGPKVIEIVGSPDFRAMLDCAREECNYHDSTANDATAIIRNEGKMQGWNACLRFLKTIHKQEAAAPAAKPSALYQDPDPRKSEQNKK